MMFMRQQWQLHSQKRQKNIIKNSSQYLVTLMVIVWSVFEYVHTQNEQEHQQPKSVVETETTTVLRMNSWNDSIHYTMDESLRNGTMDNFLTFSSTGLPVSTAGSKPVADTYDCIQCNWTQLHSHTTYLEEADSRVEWTEPAKSCWCIQELSWNIMPAKDMQGIVLHFTHFNFKWYEHLEVYAGDGHTEDKLLFRYPDLTTAVLLLPHRVVSVLVRTMPWPFFTVENAPSSFGFNYSTHPLHLMPTALSHTNTQFRRVAPLVAVDALHDCSSATIPAYILCDKVQQCVGGEDEPADCPYRSVSCGHNWFLHHDRCLQVVITSTKNTSHSCDQQSGGKLAVLAAPAEPTLLAPAIARTGISAVCLAVDLTYKNIFSKSTQMESQYRHILQWGEGIMNHGDLPQRDIRTDSKFALFFSHGKVSARTLYGSECDYKTTVTGFVCMKDNVNSTDLETDSPRSVSLRLHSNSTYNDSTSSLPANSRLKSCTDDSFVFQFQQCPQEKKKSSWSPNNFKLFDCMLGGQVHYAMVCDGHNDCDDGSDETGCQIPTDISILQSYHVCANGQLIPFTKKNYMCDGATDCLDQSDERLCTTCAEGTILCSGFGCRPPSHADFLTCTSSYTDKTEILFTTATRFPGNKAEMPPVAVQDGGVDLVIILHSTNSMTDWDYSFIKQQLILMLRFMKNSTVHIRLGIMAFSSQAHVHFMLKDLSTIYENDINNLTLTSYEGTNIAGALRKARTKMFSEQNGDRRDAPNVILLITAALSDVNASDVIKEADETKKGQGIHILAVGVGVTDTQELRNIVSWPLEESLFLTKRAVGVGQPLYKIAFALLPLGTLPDILDKPRHDVMNIALRKPTFLSTPNINTYGHSRHGVDGTAHRCTIMNGHEPYPYRWFRVDLMALFEIYGVSVTNSACCGWEHLRNFSLYVTSVWAEPPDNHQNSTELCLHYPERVGHTATVHLNCTQPITGRYFTMVLYTPTFDLVLCEIQVFGAPPIALSNVALNKPAAMSTVHKNFRPENGADGLRGPYLSQCVHSAGADSLPYRWWRVDLLGLFKIYSVIITNRADCCGWRLKNFYILVTMSSAELPEDPENSGVQCLHHPEGIADGATVSLPCIQPIEGRYVTLVMYTNVDILNFCELEALGVPVLENWSTQRIYPPALLHMDGLGLSTAEELKAGQEVCPETHFQCARGFCIPTYLLNNGIIDCPLGEDENISDLNCPGFFRCWVTGNCLHPDYYCDGVNHCPFNEDERYCGQEHCPVQCVCEGKAFRCKSGFDYQAHFQLRYLDLTGSNNPDLKGAELLTYLQYLNLSSCEMKAVTLGSLSQLRILDVSHNSIGSFDFLKLSHLSELVHLNLSFNPLSKLLDPAFSNFVRRAAFIKLHSLVMVDAGIHTITTEGLTGSTQISELDIRHNPVDTLPTKVFGKSIRVLYTDNLKLCCHHFHVTQLAECHAPADELSSCSDLLRSDFLRVLLWILSTMALIGNVGVWIYRTFIEQQGTSLAYKVMVINLSASDFLMGVYMTMIGAADVIFRGVYVLKEQQWRHTAVCKTAGFLAIVSSEMSAFVICLITVDRFLLLRFPFSLRLRLSKLSASVACCVAWLAAILLAILPLFMPHWQFYSQNSICLPLPITQRQFPGQHYAFGVFIVLNFIISTVIGVGQVFIYHTIRQSSKGLQKDSRNQEVTIARRLFLIVVTDFCCWFPIGLMGLLAAQGTHISDLVNVWAAVFVLPLNSALNPFLYTLNTLLERRARHVEQKRMEKIMTNIYQQMRTWPGEKMLEHVRKCLSFGLLEQQHVLEVARHCPEPGQQGKEEKVKLRHGQPDH